VQNNTRINRSTEIACFLNRFSLMNIDPGNDLNDALQDYFGDHDLQENDNSEVILQ